MQDLVFIPGPFHKESLQIILLLSPAGDIRRNMGWIIVDTNQAGRFRPSFISSHLPDMEGFVLQPFVLGEVWKSNNSRQTIEKLVQYPLRIGMTTGEVMNRLASLRRSQILAFRPFHNISSNEIKRTLLSLPNQEAAKEVQKFVIDTTKHIKTSADFFHLAKEKTREAFRKHGHDPRKFKFSGFFDALQQLGRGPEDIVEWMILESVSANNPKNVRLNPRAFYDAVMKNPYLRRFFYSLLWYIISSQQAWTREYDKWNISIKHNDWTDITLPLYAAPDDIIMSEDKNVREVIAAVNPDGAVKVVWDRGNCTE